MAIAKLIVHPISSWATSNWPALARRPLAVRSGRGTMHLVEHPKGILLERPYLHGGLRRAFMAAWFFNSYRPARELAIHRHLFEQGLPTVEPVAWAEIALPLPGFRKFFYYSRYLVDSKPLPQWLQGQSPSRGLMAQMAAILAKLHQLGIFHHDLNLNNWLVARDRVYLIDFDKARADSRQASTYLRACLRRMIRSARKLGFLERPFSCMRFLVLTATEFGLSPHALLADLTADLRPVRWYNRLSWKVFGGHRA